jgi:hypothetical protein
MNILLISYDLGVPETSQDYEAVIDYIKSHNWAKPLKSLWLIKTNKTTSTVRDELKSITDANDKIFVVNITGDAWATARISSDVTQWMKNNL